ncbi:MAG: hypothetical protein IMW92_01150 [Bacillales bacterium]|nr:hypothetical protein [Bacillales bacterium]
MEQAYFSSEVAKRLGIGASTLRKYALALEENGYHFDRGINHSRVFYREDIAVVERIIEAITKNNISFEKAIQIAVEQSRKQQENQSLDTPKQEMNVQNQDVYERLQQLEQGQNRLIEINRELIGKLEQQQVWIKQKMEEIKIEERDRYLIQSLGTTQENKTKKWVRPFESLATVLFGEKKKRKRNKTGLSIS